MSDPKITTPAAYACGFCTCAMIYFAAMQTTGGWCMSRDLTTALGILSLCGVIPTAGLLLRRRKGSDASEASSVKDGR